MSSENTELSCYQRIYNLVRLIPAGKVATYGQVARLVGRSSARQVGYAMSALPPDSDVPWQRVVNSKGQISDRRDGFGHLVQRALLEEEGISFDKRGRIDIERHGWDGERG